MTQTFKCPSCSAPLEFEGKTMQKCRFCGSNVIVPSSAIQNSNVFGSFGEMNFGDFSSLTGKALKIAEIQQLIQSGSKIQAIKVFRETFNTGLKEAKDAVDAMERGEGIDISGMRVQTTHTQMNAHNFNAAKKAVKIGAGGAFFAFVFVGIIVFGVGVAVYFLVSNSANKNFDRTFTSTSNTTTTTTNTTKTSGKPKLADEILKFGDEGTGAGKFKDNRNIAVGGDGRIYSGDYNGGKIQVFDADGKYLSQWMVDEKMNLYDMTADRKGNVYILNNKGIFVYKGESGELAGKLEKIRAEGMTLTLDGKLIVTNDKGFSVYDANLKLIQDFQDASERASSARGFEGVAVDGNNVIYAVDNQNGDICKFSADGKFLNRFKSGTTSSRPIAIDNKGRIFVSDVSHIYVFDAEGKQINSFDTTQAFAMTFNDADELFVAARPFILKYKINF